MKYSLNNIIKALDKLFKAGFIDEKSIINMKIEDLVKLNNMSGPDILVIAGFIQAIKDKKLVVFLSSDYKERKDDYNA